MNKLSTQPLDLFSASFRKWPYRLKHFFCIIFTIFYALTFAYTHEASANHQPRELILDLALHASSPTAIHSGTSPSANSNKHEVARVSSRPYVSAIRPANGTTNVSLSASISVDLVYPDSSIDGSTVSPATVKLYELKGTQKTLVSGTAVNSSAAGDAITLSAPLELGTNYEFEITDKVKDLGGKALIPFTSRFTTTNTRMNPLTGLEEVAFTAHTLISSDFGKDGFTTLTIGPDHRLYAATSGGKIERWDIKADGTLQNHVTISPFGDERRLLIGFHFDPAATSKNLIAWLSHSSSEFQKATDWSSRISKVDLSNPSSPKSTLYVTNLPRSYKDHSINSIEFGPDGALYVPMGSNTAMGAPSAFWAKRNERLLSAAVLRLDIAKAEKFALPLDVRTPDGGGTYNPYATDAPLTLYATGIRNAYDLVWHSNGQLYVPTNGSAAGGYTPALQYGKVRSDGTVYKGPFIRAMADVRATQSDYLFRVEKGGYYGHPNPLRNEYIMNGGNPTSGQDPAEVVWNAADGTLLGYPVGTLPEPNLRDWSYEFGPNISPNGIIEYKSNAFGGKLKGRLLVCRFSGGDDIMILEPNAAAKEITSAIEGILVPGLRRPYSNPLDIIEDELTGNLYISEYFEGNGDGVPQITLLKAAVPAGMEVPEDAAAVKLEIYPNPVAGAKVTVAVHKLEKMEEVEITLLDVAGRKTYSTSVTADAHGTALTELVIEQHLSGGIYLVRIQSSSGKAVSKRLVVE
jgi:hypothetical protein